MRRDSVFFLTIYSRLAEALPQNLLNKAIGVTLVQSINNVAVIGSGVIGSSWAALFLAAGHRVRVYDPSPDFEQATRQRIADVWPTLESLGMTERGDQAAINFVSSAAEAVKGAEFVQENVPEREGIKHALYAQIEPALSEGAIVSSSTLFRQRPSNRRTCFQPLPKVL